MLDFLFVALLQAVAGDPAVQQPAEAAQPAQTETQQQPQQEVDPRDVVRCRTVRPAGARVGGERLCTTPRQDEELRQATMEMRNRLQTSTSAPPPPPGMQP